MPLWVPRAPRVLSPHPPMQAPTVSQVSSGCADMSRHTCHSLTVRKHRRGHSHVDVGNAQLNAGRCPQRQRHRQAHETPAQPGGVGADACPLWARPAGALLGRPDPSSLSMVPSALSGLFPQGRGEMCFSQACPKDKGSVTEPCPRGGPSPTPWQVWPGLTGRPVN